MISTWKRVDAGYTVVIQFVGRHHAATVTLLDDVSVSACSASASPTPTATVLTVTPTATLTPTATATGPAGHLNRDRNRGRITDSNRDGRHPFDTDANDHGNRASGSDNDADRHARQWHDPQLPAPGRDRLTDTALLHRAL